MRDNGPVSAQLFGHPIDGYFKKINHNHFYLKKLLFKKHLQNAFGVAHSCFKYNEKNSLNCT